MPAGGFPQFYPALFFVSLLETQRIAPMKEKSPLEPGDYYLSAQGYRVFTEQYHLKRGYCCESSCRHCPYGYNPR